MAYLTIAIITDDNTEDLEKLKKSGKLAEYILSKAREATKLTATVEKFEWCLQLKNYKEME